MKILFIHGHMFNVHTWSKVCDLLRAEGVELHFFSQVHSAQAALDFLHNQTVDLFIGQLFHDLPRHDELLAGAQQAACRIGLGVDIPPEFSSFGSGQSARFAHYLSHISEHNYLNGIRFLMACTGKEVAYAEPEPVQTHGVYHPEAASFFESTSAYLRWRQERNAPFRNHPLVGLLCYYGQIAEGNCAEIDAVIRCLEANNLIPLCVACEGMADSSLPLAQRYTWLAFFQEADPPPAALLNLLAGRLLSRPEDLSILETLNVPVVQLIRLHHQSPEEWRADSGGLGAGAQSMVYALSQPEMAGVIEPTAVAASRSETDARTGLQCRRYVPLDERIQHLCRRLHRLIRLRALPHREKRLTIVLHNNPCKGVEATLGLAAGLNTFASLADLIRSLREAGYEVGDAPEDGAALLNLLLERKAFSEFRWTTTDEIVAKGGVLHSTTKGEYENILTRLPVQARERIEADWGPFPGEGMVSQKNGEAVLLVTGLRFGNLQIMVQPKRGCYGAKCNGEVCRILHDPHLSPPPHWLATYQYIRDTSDAVLHFGAHGSLEFLPGKQVALSDECFPEISLDDLPNIYLYVMDVPSEGLVAKRRGRAVLVDHLTPVQRPAELDEDITNLEQLLEQHQKAGANGEGARLNLLREQMLPLMRRLHFIDREDLPSDRFDEAAPLLSRQIARCRRTLTPLGLHRLGTAPAPEGVAVMLATILIKPAEDLPSLEEIAEWSAAPSGNVFNDARDLIQSLLDPQPTPTPKRAEPARFAALLQWCREVAGRIVLCSREIPQLLKALDGGFIEPGLSGSLALGKTQTLPTGRNFYTSDVLAMPTRAAWEVGRTLADNLLSKYLREEGRFPESVGVSLWSIDAFKSDGEMFCQILHLMGVRPRWAANGRVAAIEAVDLDSLTLEVEHGPALLRPRVDVVVQTSSILRDMVPHFADLLDEAAVMAGDLDEPLERNSIRKHTLERLAELRQELAESLSESDLKRLASFRVFSSAPGTCGTGIGLALDASAWESDDDLAEIHINWGGYAYGSDRVAGSSRAAGMEAHRLYARSLKTLDVAYMRQYSPEHDLVDCGCYSSCLGGMSVAARAVSGKRAKLYWADVNAEGDLSVRDLKDDLNASVRAKLLNAHWIEQQKENGYKGAGCVSGCVNTLFHWSAATGEVDKWVFDAVATTFIRNQENLEWLRRDNPYGLEEMTRRLLEAHSRGLWQADPELLQEVQAAALLVEGDMEEIIGEVGEEFQGSRVEVLTARDVAKWRPAWRLKDGP
ncbi:cobaltochelatase subunit CobN [Desulfobulbus sp.]|uniref:cobaltochelatase subunit CobN n=1 Tax=Desulfobulbus sp. TaxID=895 RepID=UPI0027B9E713|nr:cobaltochelatase subunit CobN [Desulfobulbus sp.]